jgi:hypothetical protein
MPRNRRATVRRLTGLTLTNAVTFAQRLASFAPICLRVNRHVSYAQQSLQQQCTDEESRI